MRRRWFSVFSLSAASFVDGGEGQALSILWPSIRRSLGVSLGQLGPVLGISQFISTLLLPLWGYATDRYSRKWLLTIFTGLWGVWTLAIGLVDTFSQLMMVRVLSALGTGVVAPASFSLIGDLFNNEKRGRVTGIMIAMGIIGSIVSFGVLPTLALSNEEAWRLGFVAMGIASLITGVLLMIVKEPRRGAAESELHDVIDEATERYTFRPPDLKKLFHIRSWRLMVAYETADTIGFSILLNWAFTWLDELGITQSAFFIVALMSLGSIIGSILFGWLGDHVEQRFPRSGRVTMVLSGMVITLPVATAFIVIGNKNIFLMVILGFMYGIGRGTSGFSTLWPVTQAVLPPELRGSGRAMISVATGTAGALMLTLSGWVADQVGISAMLLLLVPLPGLLAILVWLPMRHAYARDRANLHDMLRQRREELLSEPLCSD